MSECPTDQGTLSLLGRREMQINTARIWPPSPVTLTEIKTLIRSKVGWDVGGSHRSTLKPCWWESKVSSHPGRQFCGIFSFECIFTLRLNTLFSASSLSKRHAHSPKHPHGAVCCNSKQKTMMETLLPIRQGQTLMNYGTPYPFGRILDEVKDKWRICIFTWKALQDTLQTW